LHTFTSPSHDFLDQIKRHKLNYFKSFWNILDILVLIIAVCCVAFNIYRTVTVAKLLDTLLDYPNEYADFEFLSYWQIVFNSALAIMVFFAWVKVRDI
jgi:ABC-type maltose transport system permease subunit